VEQAVNHGERSLAEHVGDALDGRHQGVLDIEVALHEGVRRLEFVCQCCHGRRPPSLIASHPRKLASFRKDRSIDAGHGTGNLEIWIVVARRVVGPKVALGDGFPPAHVW
jgi:hypothetical protein